MSNNIKPTLKDPSKMERADWVIKCRECGGWVQLSAHANAHDDLLYGPRNDYENSDNSILLNALEFYIYTHLYCFDVEVIDFSNEDDRPEMCKCKPAGGARSKHLDAALKRWNNLLERYSRDYMIWGEDHEVEITKRIVRDWPKECEDCSVKTKCSECRSLNFVHKKSEV
jgi:hypothetical protein